MAGYAPAALPRPHGRLDMEKLRILDGIEYFIEKDGTIYLKLEIVARGLGFTDDSKGKEYVRWSTVKGYLADCGFSQEVAKTGFIPEPVFYMLAMKANNEAAKAFQRKVAYEILPAIRKHGMYAVDDLLENPDLAIKAFTALKEERRQRIEAEKEIKQLEAELDRSKDWYSIKRVAALNGVNWKTFSWRKLKDASERVGIKARKIFDANYGEVNVYHAKAWEFAYPDYEL